MWNILIKMQKNLTYTIPLFLIMGLVTGSITDPSGLKILIIPMTFLMVYPMMVTIDFKKFLEKGDFKLQVATSLLISVLSLLSRFFWGLSFSRIITWLHSDCSLHRFYPQAG
jgi:ACR3 family arsenite efflux pump ArsB